MDRNELQDFLQRIEISRTAHEWFQLDREIRRFPDSAERQELVRAIERKSAQVVYKAMNKAMAENPQAMFDFQRRIAERKGLGQLPREFSFSDMMEDEAFGEYIQRAEMEEAVDPNFRGSPAFNNHRIAIREARSADQLQTAIEAYIEDYLLNDAEIDQLTALATERGVEIAADAAQEYEDRVGTEELRRRAEGIHGALEADDPEAFEENLADTYEDMTGQDAPFRGQGLGGQIADAFHGREGGAADQDEGAVDEILGRARGLYRQDPFAEEGPMNAAAERRRRLRAMFAQEAMGDPDLLAEFERLLNRADERRIDGDEPRQLPPGM